MPEPALPESMTVAAPKQDRRRAARLRSLLTGVIVFDDRRTMTCVVRNISAHGGQIVLAEAFRLPEEFDLRIPHRDQAHHARIVWRRGEAAGVALSDADDIPHRPRQRPTRREAQRAHQREMDAAQF